MDILLYVPDLGAEIVGSGRIVDVNRQPHHVHSVLVLFSCHYKKTGYQYDDKYHSNGQVLSLLPEILTVTGLLGFH